MRNGVGLAVVLLVCVILGSCASSPEKAFMGTWEATVEEGTLELSFMQEGIWTVKPRDSAQLMNSGTWAIGPDGNAVMTHNDGEAIVSLMDDGRLAVREDEGVHLFERTDKRKK